LSHHERHFRVTNPITVRPINYERDPHELRTFLDERDRLRLEHSAEAVEAGDAFIFVADDEGKAVGWVVVHTRYRDDQDWEPDEDGKQFQAAENAYMENIEVTARARGRGVGKRLLEAVHDEARKRGKRTVWLHTSENNAMAHRLFEREGWVHERTVNPPWKPANRTRIYRKDL
jgi:GNAT superfamily N-acetyltransferase